MAGTKKFLVSFEVEPVVYSRYAHPKYTIDKVRKDVLLRVFFDPDKFEYDVRNLTVKEINEIQTTEPLG